jgi:hypothetical protein
MIEKCENAIRFLTWILADIKISQKTHIMHQEAIL